MEKNAVEVIAEAMLEKKALNVVSLDLRPIDTAITDFFLVCSAASTATVAAIADHVLVRMQERCGRKVLRMQGLENDFWVILDFGEVVVHIFLTEYRDFYHLEDLWADAPRREFDDTPPAEAEAGTGRQKPKAASRVRALARRHKTTDEGDGGRL